MTFGQLYHWLHQYIKKEAVKVTEAAVTVRRQSNHQKRIIIMASNKMNIAVIPGDGIGTEVIPEGLRVLNAAADKYGLELSFDQFNFSSCNYYQQHGQMMPDNWKDQIGKHDAIFFGAVGWPDTGPEQDSLLGSLLQVRPEVYQYGSLRPSRFMPGVTAPLTGRCSGDREVPIRP